MRNINKDRDMQLITINYLMMIGSQLDFINNAFFSLSNC